ncbi:PdhC [Desulfurella acetivorans A63]|nr:PdhC [Desulfurella acetivorans A63]
MHSSLSNSAQITVMGEIDAYELVNLREQLLNKESELGVRITYTDLLVYFVSRTLKDFSLINSSIIDNEIKIWEDVNIGVAVALEDGLIVPVIKNADKKTLIEISKNLKDLSNKARERKLEISDVKGSTFSLTNLGAFGGGYRFETVIINQPESAILGTGGIVDRPVVVNKEIVIRPIMTYYLTYDHRVIDGALAAKFINKLKEVLENASKIYGGKYE